jgi:predicted phage terminase large subunit-like protein
LSLSLESLSNLPSSEGIRAELARRRLADFLEYDSRGAWRRARHLERLCHALESVERGEIDRLMVFMPPRHGKSEVCSKKFPAWYEGRNPDKEIIICSYAADLAYDFSRIARDTLRERGPELWEIKVSSDSSAVGRWGIEGKRGGCVAAGVGGPITGRGAHVGIIDDPFKNAEEAASQTIRDKVWEWYRSTFRTRLAPGGAIVLVMTRWHEDDLAGRLIAEMQAGGEQWVIIEMQAEAEEGDPLGRAIGETLWPEHGFDKAWAEATKVAVGSYFWQALYQQRPSAPEGEILKRGWWKFYKAIPADLQEVIQSWDMTFKDSDGSDFVVGGVWGRKGADKYLLDQVRGRMDFPTTLAAVKALTAKWPQARAKLVEDKANGPAVIAMLKREIPGLIPVEPQGSKMARVAAVSPEIEAGNVYLPDPSIAPWVSDFIEECSAFPNGKHDDQVDQMSQALLRFGQRRSMPPIRKPRGW